MAIKKVTAKKGTATSKKATVSTDNGGVVIEKGIPVPARTRQGAWGFLKELAVGDSFFLAPQEGEDSEAVRIRSRQAYQSAIKTHKIKLVYRSENNGIRMWRTA